MTGRLLGGIDHPVWCGEQCEAAHAVIVYGASCDDLAVGWGIGIWIRVYRLSVRNSRFEGGRAGIGGGDRGGMRGCSTDGMPPTKLSLKQRHVFH